MRALGLLCLAFFAPLTLLFAAEPANTATNLITISTAHTSLSFGVGPDGRLYHAGYGASEAAASLEKTPPREIEFYPPSGDGFILEPALQAIHSDGNTSTDLIFEKQTSTSVEPDVKVTRVELHDPFYPFFVTLCFKAYQEADVIEQWTEIRHDENRPVTLGRFASSALLAPKTPAYWLTQLHGDWADEAQWIEERLTPGIKVLDSKIGVRAHQFRTPSFLIALDQQAQEENGTVIGGSLEWSGSFQFAFEIDQKSRLRALCGINPFGSEYHLLPQQTFTTPGMLWTWSDRGKGQVSRNFHRWARRYGLRDGGKPRPVLLNNWEATGFNFDEARIVALFDGARVLGAETFLLDDGWFGNRHPRNDDKAGLGDWQVNTNKLPHGLSYLADEAKKRGVNFGIWLEPEMVNPASDLFEQHPEWAIGQKHREPILGRNQRVLDLSRPEVREFTWKVIQDTLTPNPGISYVKWDCNCYVTQPGSTWLGPNEQSHLLIDYQHSLYEIMGRFATNYPQVMSMLCSGGAGRLDYGALKYFHSFWPSDNTDPARRVFIQWGFSHFFPPSSMATHVTRMGDRPIKFTLDVAMSGALGLDLDVRKLTPQERKQIADAVALYKTEIRDLVTQGDLYRLESPYAGPRAALDLVSPDRSRAVLFIYQLKEGPNSPIRLQGLDRRKTYRLREVNLSPGETSNPGAQDRTVPGEFLSSDGLLVPLAGSYRSAVIQLTAE
ncbi:MAG TPA: alpha-galactosidase [Verrucomicrobiae bacterium]|nr:alpha-galactosidase [Verrucomicrobiae bacterium]